jgi:hypothetical protein
MKFTLKNVRALEHFHFSGSESEEMGLIDALNREQTGRIVVSALYHRNSWPQGSDDAILVNSWIP